MSVKVYGASDDLIEIEGDISEEFQAYGDDDQFLSFSNGEVWRVKYTNEGIWRFTPVCSVGDSVYEFQATEDDEDNYSDIVIVGPTSEPIAWVVLGNQIAKA